MANTPSQTARLSVNEQDVSFTNPVPVSTATSYYASPNSNKVQTNTTLDSLFSDDFGGSAINASNWDVLDGGLGANVNLGNGTLTQAAIGTGTTGMTDSVAASGLTVNMNTTSGAERWYLSKQAFAGKEDILVLLSKSQNLAANSIFVGLCEVDPTTLVPLLNPNFANEFTNRGGCEFALTAVSAIFQAEAIGDSSATKAVGVTGNSIFGMTTTQEYLIEIDSRDIIVSNSAIDSVAGKAAGASRVSSQCPNDKKLYKLVMRFKNVSAPGSNTSVVIQRVLVADNYEQRVQISTGEGDSIAAKAVPVNITANSANFGINYTTGGTGGNGLLKTKLIAAATTNATSVKNAGGRIFTGMLSNLSATVKFVKFYNKASAPTVGTDTPVTTIPIQANSQINLCDVFGIWGEYFNTGIAFAITGAAADADATAVAAGDVVVSIGYA